jgi:hypothetical protein
MKKILFAFFLCSLNVFSQETFHDPALDQINGSLGNIDADINGYYQQYGAWLSMNSVTNYGKTAMQEQLNFTSDSATSAGTNSSRIKTAYSNILGGTTLTISVPTNGSPTNSNINLGNFIGRNFQMSLSPDPQGNYSSIFEAVRGCIKALIYLALFRYSLTYIQSETFSMMCQRQMSGVSQQILGFNASGPSALIYCGIITGSIIALLGYIVTNGFIRVALNNTNLFSNSFTVLFNTPAYLVVTTLFPLADALGAYTAYIIFRYILAFPLFLTIRGVIFWMIR